MDDYGRISQAGVGGTPCTWSYDSNNLLSQVGATGVQQYDYSFNVNTGNLNSRTNFLKSLSESFGYDAEGLDRLTMVTGPCGMTTSYGSNGNIQSKSDAGTYAYNNTPYAVSSITGTQNISTTPQHIDYYSFEKVKTITEGTRTADFVYNANQQRIRMILKDNGVTTKTRWYFGSSVEREQEGGTTTQYIWIGGDAYSAVAVAKKVGSGSWEVFSIFRDHLGTITHLKIGSTVYEYSFDAWGRRRDKDTWSYTLEGEPALFCGRGFTGHEHLDDFNLVNMNGRMYDPVAGRFLSADNEIRSAGFTQGFNRYSYALNNPLRYIDPSGNANIERATYNDPGWFVETYIPPYPRGTGGGGGFRGSPGVHGPGVGMNGEGLNGIYYDWYSKTYRDMQGEEAGWGQVSGVVSDYGITLPSDAILSSIRINNQGVGYQSVSVGSQERVGPPGSTFNVTFSIDVVNSFVEYSASNEGGYSGDGPLFTVADWTNNGIGGLATGMERSGGTFRLSNSRGFSPRHYASGWRGNGSVTTYNTTTWGSRIAKGSLVVNLGLGAYSINKANIADGRTFGYNTQVATAQVAGGMAGSWAGASIGASIGVWFGGVGAVPGAVIGGVIGGVLGGWGGSELGGAAVDWYY